MLTETINITVSSSSTVAYDPPCPVRVTDRLYSAFRWKAIIAEAAVRHGLSIAEIVGSSRSRWIAWPRFEAIYNLRKELGWSLPQIGRRMGDRDHTTVLHALRRYDAPAVQEWLAYNAERVAMKRTFP